MSLIKCSACSKPVSSGPLECPYCGEITFPPASSQTASVEPAQFTKKQISEWGWISLGLIVLGMYLLDLSLEHGNMFYVLGMLLGALGFLGLVCWAIMGFSYLTGM